MVFKVIVIDDEPIIREGLKNIINWKQFNCRICGEASDGLKGLELIKQHLPDLIITDIRMPKLDGLTMIGEIKTIVPGAKIIILTGYRNFEYIQEALKLGASDFILKPSKIEELTMSIGKAVHGLKLQKESLEENKRLREQFEQNIPILREKLLYDILYGINTDKNEITEKMELFRLEINCFILIIIEIDDGSKEVDQYSKHLYQFGIINTFNEIFSSSFEVTSISLDNKRIAFITQPLDSAEDYINTVYDKCSYLQSMIGNCFGFTVTAVISTEGRCAFELPDKLKECRQALDYKLHTGNNSIIPFNDLHSIFYTKMDYSQHFEDYRLSLLESIKIGNEEKARASLQAIFDYTSRIGKADKDYLKGFYLSLLSSLQYIKSTVLKTDDIKNYEYEDINSLIKSIQICDSVIEMNSIIEEVVFNATAAVNCFYNKSMNLIVQKAVDYINKNYYRQITLREVAEYTYVSTYYISRIFKKELGKNFVDYLTEVRIEKAKELLKSLKYKTYEVADMVGISDSHYFSKLFKKQVGITPSEYKDILEIT